MTQKTMEPYSSANNTYFHIAVAILDSFLATYGSQTNYNESEGDILS